jgi:hypothetical protein
MAAHRSSSFGYRTNARPRGVVLIEMVECWPQQWTFAADESGTILIPVDLIVNSHQPHGNWPSGIARARIERFDGHLYTIVEQLEIGFLQTGQWQRGLAILRNQVDQHQGKIARESSPGAHRAFAKRLRLA